MEVGRKKRFLFKAKNNETEWRRASVDPRHAASVLLEPPLPHSPSRFRQCARSDMPNYTRIPYHLSGGRQRYRGSGGQPGDVRGQVTARASRVVISNLLLRPLRKKIQIPLSASATAYADTHRADPARTVGALFLGPLSLKPSGTVAAFRQTWSSSLVHSGLR